jgi:hypothetical protein
VARNGSGNGNGNGNGNGGVFCEGGGSSYMEGKGKRRRSWILLSEDLMCAVYPTWEFNYLSQSLVSRRLSIHPSHFPSPHSQSSQSRSISPPNQPLQNVETSSFPSIRRYLACFCYLVNSRLGFADRHIRSRPMLQERRLLLRAVF